jgi:hypothetical protein
MKKETFKGAKIVVQPSKPDTKGAERNQDFVKKKRKKKSGSRKRVYK